MISDIANNAFLSKVLRLLREFSLLSLQFIKSIGENLLEKGVSIVLLHGHFSLSSQIFNFVDLVHNFLNVKIMNSLFEVLMLLHCKLLCSGALLQVSDEPSVFNSVNQLYLNFKNQS